MNQETTHSLLSRLLYIFQDIIRVYLAEPEKLAQIVDLFENVWRMKADSPNTPLGISDLPDTVDTLITNLVDLNAECLCGDKPLEDFRSHIADLTHDSAMILTSMREQLKIPKGSEVLPEIDSTPDPLQDCEPWQIKSLEGFLNRMIEEMDMDLRNRRVSFNYLRTMALKRVETFVKYLPLGFPEGSEMYLKDRLEQYLAGKTTDLPKSHRLPPIRVTRYQHYQDDTNTNAKDLIGFLHDWLHSSSKLPDAPNQLLQVLSQTSKALIEGKDIDWSDTRGRSFLYHLLETTTDLLKFQMDNFAPIKDENLFVDTFDDPSTLQEIPYTEWTPPHVLEIVTTGTWSEETLEKEVWCIRCGGYFILGDIVPLELRGGHLLDTVLPCPHCKKGLQFLSPEANVVLAMNIEEIKFLLTFAEIGIMFSDGNKKGPSLSRDVSAGIALRIRNQFKGNVKLTYREQVEWIKENAKHYYKDIPEKVAQESIRVPDATLVPVHGRGAGRTIIIK